MPRTRTEVEAEIMTEYVSYLAADLAGNADGAAEHYALMDAALEEVLHIPLQPRLPSDRDGHTAPRPV